MAKLAQAKILEIIKVGENVKIRVLFDKLPIKPIAPAQIGKVELHKVLKIDGLEITFESYNINEKMLAVGEKYDFFKWWADWQFEIAQSNPNDWHKETFFPSDGEVIEKEGRVEVRRPSGGAGHVYTAKDWAELCAKDIKVPTWDHDHCGLCWKTISSYETDEHGGYTDGQDWVCGNCFEKYIASGFGKKLG